jgi:ATP-dependent Zn protease
MNSIVTNGKNWLQKGLLQLAIILALVVYVIVQGSTKSEASQSQLMALSERVARMEECVLTLRPLPIQVAGINEAIQNLKKSVDDLKKKIENGPTGASANAFWKGQVSERDRDASEIALRKRA